ncbi:MAG: hypothetical protein A2498_06150 [Lentisphaerae bacterium RIFOXYC12_FULL_60_16]|nr:MAG: hypothetical protein A2498_06150 [Lentisphaerae bacterium RIFOXYC12_FULL_60_16]OGV85380.1 MAG: hypothetical protein A2340_13900 [Lentisphaerae bacterium RIFOXYB12_FULL_60_10]
MVHRRLQHRADSIHNRTGMGLTVSVRRRYAAKIRAKRAMTCTGDMTGATVLQGVPQRQAKNQSVMAVDVFLPDPADTIYLPGMVYRDGHGFQIGNHFED